MTIVDRRHLTSDGTRRFFASTLAFLEKGVEVEISTLPAVCQYSITKAADAWLEVRDPSLLEEFTRIARRFRKPGTLITEVKGGRLSLLSKSGNVEWGAPAPLSYISNYQY